MTNYLGSIQFYLSVTHQRILIVVMSLALVSLIVSNGAIVWLVNYQSYLGRQAHTWHSTLIETRDRLLKLQTSVAQSQVKTKELKHYLTELTDYKYKVTKQLDHHKKKALLLEQSLIELQTLLGGEVVEGFDLGVVHQMSTTAKYRLELLANIPNAWPMIKPTVVTSAYGYRLHPISGIRKMHKGIDLRCKEGSPILATANGVVASSTKMPGFGNNIILNHNYGFSSRYGHLQKRLVSLGEFVYEGQTIGLCGSTGLSSAPHLHYEILFLDKNSNPKPFVNWNLSNFDGFFDQVPEVKWQSLIKPPPFKSTKTLQ